MNPLYRVWWRFMMDLRPMVRFTAERLPKLAPWGVRIRIVLHWIIGNPIQVVAVLNGLAAWRVSNIDVRLIAGLVASAFILMELYHRLGSRSGGSLIG
jgi:hypothetical protein